ncbi:TRAP transporter small permease [Labrenzia sp. CE80]|uniref:TRAP transporter small permease n=1 Tax=Labrenzia sp. CE80 TaxID=1788986 RepID=UPI00129A9F97|nr:TRAP transporter small permease [Labrenzia sp. CE80]
MLSKIDRFVGVILRAIPTFCFAALFLLLLINVIARTFQLAGFSWFDEVVQGLFAWMVFIGAAALWREKDHFQVDWLPRSLPVASARIVRIMTCVLGVTFLIVMTKYGADLTQKAKALTPILDLPTGLFYAAIPLSGATMLIYSLADLIRLVRHPLHSKEIN